MPIGAGIVGAGVANLLDRMRRVQQRHRRVGTYIRLPDPDQRVFEQRLRAGDGSSIIEDVDRSLRSVSSWWHSIGWSATITGVKVRPDCIEIVVEGLDSSVTLPDELSFGADARSLVIERPVPPEASERRSGVGRGSGRGTRLGVSPRTAVVQARETVPGLVSTRTPAPILVTAGQDESGIVMVNLEPMGSLAVSGERDLCDGFLRALALELATSRWSGQFELVLVGFGAELERFDRVSAKQDVPALIRTLCYRRARGAELLRMSGFDSFVDARCTQESDDWDPIVIVCGPSTAERDAADLVEIASDPRTGAAVVACGDQIGAAHALLLTGSHRAASLSLLGSTVFPQRVEIEELGSTSSLLETASRRDAALASDDPYVDLPIPLPGPRAGTALAAGDDRLPLNEDGSSNGGGPSGGVPSGGGPSGSETGLSSSRPGPAARLGDDGAAERPPVEVGVLGPIVIRGAAREFTRAWAKELVVYLAMHPGGAPNEAWATALWPDRLMAPSSLHSTASVARRSLGQAPDGQDHLPRSHGRLALANSVGTDWDRFVSLAGSSDIEQWRSALELIRGRPFEGLRSTDWPILEGIGPAIEAAAVDLSGRLSGAYLATDRPQDSQWAARKGLLVSPYDERLYRMLLRAADAAGNPAGVETVMGELIQLVADDIEPFDSIHPATIDLYRSLSRSRRKHPDPTARKRSISPQGTDG
ncbi:MAG: AfsR/SARP family transcriptional regulator [Acidimicrobiales bacterium]